MDYTILSDFTLIHILGNGSTALEKDHAEKMLYNKYQNPIKKWLGLKFSGQDHEFRDTIFQDSFNKLMKKIRTDKSYAYVTEFKVAQNKNSFRNLLITTAKNSGLNRIRDGVKFQNPTVVEDGVVVEKQWAVTYETPESSMIGKEIRGRIGKVLYNNNDFTNNEKALLEATILSGFFGKIASSDDDSYYELLFQTRWNKVYNTIGSFRRAIWEVNKKFFLNFYTLNKEFFDFKLSFNYLLMLHGISMGRRGTTRNQLMEQLKDKYRKGMSAEEVIETLNSYQYFGEGE